MYSTHAHRYTHLIPRWVLRPLLLGEERIRKILRESSVQYTILIANRRILSKSLSSSEVPRITLGTVPSGKAMGAVLGGLAVNGKLIMIGVSNESIEIPPTLFILGRRSVVGWPAGTSMDSQDTLSFSVLSGVKSMNEVFPLEHVHHHYCRQDRRPSGPHLASN